MDIFIYILLFRRKKDIKIIRGVKYLPKRKTKTDFYFAEKIPIKNRFLFIFTAAGLFREVGRRGHFIVTITRERVILRRI
jgi:hypothetical protein